ncbi:MAG: hypothetical protein Q9174_006305 [Haloplaca sp. 1 TL-2023]
MAGVKRASEGATSAAKRPRPDKHNHNILSKDLLDTMSKDDLVAHILKLQSQILSIAQTPPSPPATPGLSEDEINRKATKAREMMAKGIKSQMKWKPSCKTSGARFSYSGVVASPQVFLKVFRLGADWKKKQLQFEPAEFEHTTGTDMTTSIRYGYLNLTGKHVTVRWDANDLTFTVTGSYGL